MIKTDSRRLVAGSVNVGVTVITAAESRPSHIVTEPLPAVADKLVATTPLGRIGSPEDVAQAVLYLLSADYVTGETIIVDGGRHIRG